MQTKSEFSSWFVSKGGLQTPWDWEEAVSGLHARHWESGSELPWEGTEGGNVDIR